MIKVNPDEEHVKLIRAALLKNNNYCPCQLEQTEDTKCMCKDFRDTEAGICHCGLFIKE